MAKKKNDYWTEYEKQVAEWFASGDCNCVEKTKQACKEQQELWNSQNKYEIVGNKYDPWNVEGIPWETWNDMYMENMDPDKRKKLIDTFDVARAEDPEWIFYKNRLNNL